MISQASADSSICLGIQESDADRALEAVRAEFFRELEATENIKARADPTVNTETARHAT